MASSASTWRVMVQFGANNMTGPGFASLINSVNNAHSSTKNLNAALAGLQVAGGEALMSLGRTAIGVFSQMIDKAGDFQMKMVMIQQAMGDPAKMGYVKYNQGLQQLANQRMDLMIGKNPTIFGQDDLTSIQQMLLQTGFSANAITRQGSRSGDSLGQVVAYMAEKEQLRGLSPSPQATAMNVAQFLRAYGLTGDDAYEAINTLAKVQTVTGHFNSQDLKQYEQYAGLTLRNVGVTAPDFITLAGFMSRMGMTATSGATALNNLFLQSLDPTKGVSSFESSKRFEAAVGLGMLGKVNVEEARKSMRIDEARYKALGLPYDPSQWTAAQQEKIARSHLVETMPNVFVQDYLKAKASGGGINAIASFFMGSKANLEKEYGVNRGDQVQAVYLARLLNLRGARGGMALAASDPRAYNALGSDGQATTSSLMSYFKTVSSQQPIDTLIAQARNTLHGQDATSSNRMNAIMLQLAGVDMVTGKARPDGAFALIINVMKELNQVLAEVLKFGNQHPHAMATLGIAIGGIGVLASLAGAALTGAGVIGLARVGLGGIGGGAVLRAAGSRAGNALAFMRPPNIGAGLNWADDALHFLFGGVGKGAVLAAGPRMPFTMRAGNAIGDIGARLGLGKLGGMLGFVASKMGFLLPLVAGFGLRILNWVGWVTLAIDALSWFSKHPKDIGTWVGYILKFLRDTLIPGVINVIVTVVKYIGDEFMKLIDLISHPLQIGDWAKTFMNSVQQAMQESPSVIKQGPNGHPHANGRGGGDTHVSVNVDARGATKKDAHNIAEVAAKHVVAALKTATLSTVGGTGIPGRPHALTGAT